MDRCRELITLGFGKVLVASMKKSLNLKFTLKNQGMFQTLGSCLLGAPNSYLDGREVPFTNGTSSIVYRTYVMLFPYYFSDTLCHFRNAFIDGNGLGHDQFVFFVQDLLDRTYVWIHRKFKANG